MTEAEAAAIVAKLFASFAFHRDADPLTAAAYVEHIVKLKRPDVALAAVTELAASARYTPPIADVLDTYARMLPKFAPKEIEEPPLTPEEREEMARRFRGLAMRVGKRTA